MTVDPRGGEREREGESVAAMVAGVRPGQEEEEEEEECVVSRRVR